MNEFIDLNVERYKRYTELNRRIKRNNYKLVMYVKARVLLEKSLKMDFPKEEILYVRNMVNILSEFISKRKKEELILKTKRTKLENTLKNIVNFYIMEERK